MKDSLKVGFGFGLTSGIITTLGLMVGLYSGTHSKLAVLGGILTIAIADAFSDAFGIHISQESQERHSLREVWESTVSTFLSKLIFALTFIVPVLFFKLSTAIFISVIWGLLLLGVFSYFMAKQGKEKTWKVVVGHITLALIVIFVTHYTGVFISSTFG